MESTIFHIALQHRGSHQVGRAILPLVPAWTIVALRQILKQKWCQDRQTWPCSPSGLSEPSCQIPPWTETSLESECEFISIMYDLICTINGTEGQCFIWISFSMFYKKSKQVLQYTAPILQQMKLPRFLFVTLGFLEFPEEEKFSNLFQYPLNFQFNAHYNIEN